MGYAASSRIVAYTRLPTRDPRGCRPCPFAIEFDSSSSARPLVDRSGDDENAALASDCQVERGGDVAARPEPCLLRVSISARHRRRDLAQDAEARSSSPVPSHSTCSSTTASPSCRNCVAASKALVALDPRLLHPGAVARRTEPPSRRRFHSDETSDVARVALLAETTDARASEVVDGKDLGAAPGAKRFDQLLKSPPQDGLSVKTRPVGEAGAHGWPRSHRFSSSGSMASAGFDPVRDPASVRSSDRPASTKVSRSSIAVAHRMKRQNGFRTPSRARARHGLEPPHRLDDQERRNRRLGPAMTGVLRGLASGRGNRSRFVDFTFEPATARLTRGLRHSFNAAAIVKSAVRCRFGSSPSRSRCCIPSRATRM